MRLRDFYQRLWCGRAPPERLGMLRAVVGAYALWYVGTRYDLITDLAALDPHLYRPVGVFRWMEKPLGDGLVEGMVLATLVAGIPFVLGLAHRVFGPLFALLLLATLSYRNSWSMIYHMHNPLVVHVLIIGFTRAADGFSLGEVARRILDPGRGRPEAAACYSWPIRLCCASLAAQYLLSGVAKVLGTIGLAWATGEVLREQIATDAIRKNVLGGEPMRLVFAVYDQLSLFLAIGVVTLVLELGAPLFLLHARLRRVWAVAAWLMHLGILLIMGIKFRYQLSFIAFLPYFHIERILAGVRSRLGFRSSG